MPPTLSGAFLFCAHILERNDYYKAGFIMRPHGLKGEVTIALDKDSPADWQDLKSVLLEIKGQLVPYFIERVSVRGDKAFLKLEEVDTPELAAMLKGTSLHLLKKTRPKPERGDFYNDEVIGFEIEDETKGILGKVKEMEQAGPNRFFLLLYNEKEVMIPALPPLLKSINRSKKKITVNLPDGFLDI
jgi:16S rRNA processing protein RimM